MIKRILLFALAPFAMAEAQQPPMPQPAGPHMRMAYDASKEVTLQGVVSSVEIETRGPGRMISLVFQVDATSWKVPLGPEAVMERQGISFAYGDSLIILGAPVTGPEGQIFRARQITKEGTTLVLLEANGRPSGGPGGQDHTTSGEAPR